MRNGIVCARPSVWRCGALALLVAFSCVPAAAAGPFPFEDVNDNGRWDPGVDRDITADLTPNEWYTYYSTPHSIVIPAGVTWLRSVERFTGFYLVAGKNFTVNSSINSAVYAGMVDLHATAGNLVIGPGVILNGRDYASVYAGGDIMFGRGSSLVSHGGSANLGTVNVTAQTGDITLGDLVKFTTLRELTITAVEGDITGGSGMQQAATQGSLYVDGRRVTLNGARLRASDISIYGDGLPLEFRNNRVTVPKGRFLQIYNPRSSVDITGTVLPRTASISITATHVINGPAQIGPDED